VRRRYEDLIALVPDLQSSQLRMLWNDPAHNLAEFEFVQTGTRVEHAEIPDGATSKSAPFVVDTTLIVEFDDSGRIATLVSAHRYR
jgi:hypothetical protein